MLRVHFTAEDLARTTVAADPDPLWEIVLSRFRLHDRHRPVTYRSWVRALGTTERARTAHVQAGSAVLGVLAPRGPYFPDFLTPADGRAGLAAGLDALCRTPRRELRAQLERLAGRGDLPGWAVPLAHGDPPALTRLAETLRSYHEVAIAPFTELVESVAADHAHRVHSLVTGGVDGLLAGMRPFMRWRPPVLEIDYDVDRDLYLAGRGIRFIPSYFCDRTPVSLADPDLPPVLVYPIAQQFRWNHATRRHQSLDNLVGSTRSAVLRSINAGATTTQLARRLDTSLASVSRHAAVLRDAGLVDSHRHGSAVLHSLTPLGVSLLDNERG
jgi:DNA-binding transcriptional ArsR family regulator